MTTDLQSWVGRQDTRTDVFSPSHRDSLSAILDHPPSDGDTMPPLGHWLGFAPTTRQSAIDTDGHPRRGAFLPPVPRSRRMWAGSELTFHRPLPLGEKVTRTSTITNIAEKRGSTGPLVFVTVGHVISSGNAVLVTETQDIVYRGTSTFTVPTATTQPPPGEFERTLTPDPVLLFRYSAATFNAHRIHYDHIYTTKTEGYPGLVVHGPLTATLLLDLVRRRDPDATVTAFRFTGHKPLFANSELRLSATERTGGYSLRAIDPRGHIGMTAEVDVA